MLPSEASPSEPNHPRPRLWHEASVERQAATLRMNAISSQLQTHLRVKTARLAICATLRRALNAPRTANLAKARPQSLRITHCQRRHKTGPSCETIATQRTVWVHRSGSKLLTVAASASLIVEGCQIRSQVECSPMEAPSKV